jgi:hypothetical protein
MVNRLALRLSGEFLEGVFAAAAAATCKAGDTTKPVRAARKWHIIWPLAPPYRWNKLPPVLAQANQSGIRSGHQIALFSQSHTYKFYNTIDRIKTLYIPTAERILE